MGKGRVQGGEDGREREGEDRLDKRKRDLFYEAEGIDS